MAAADYLARDELKHLLASLMPANRLILELSLATGLRVGDVVRMEAARLAPRMTIREQKTGKSRRVYIPAALLRAVRAQAGEKWAFPGRPFKGRPEAHRSTSAVYKDLRRAAALWRLPEGLHISPHTARKVWAVSEFQRRGSLADVQRLLQHSSEAVTLLYAMADVLTQRRLSGRAKPSRKGRSGKAAQ